MSDVDLGNIDVGLDADFSGGVDIGLDAVANALTTGIRATATVAGGLDIGLANVNADLGLDDIRLRELATIKLEAAIKELPLIRTDSKVDLGLDDIRIRELPELKLELGFRPIRVHLPLNYSFCVELFGFRLFKFSVCGEGMAIAEDYKAHATEVCS